MDWGDNISDFEKIDFLGHGAILGCSQPLVRNVHGHQSARNDRTTVGRNFFHVKLVSEDVSTYVTMKFACTFLKCLMVIHI